MSLTGTLDTLSVPELLSVLAATKGSGELVVRAEGLEGRLWLADGGLVKADVPDITDLVEAVCALLGLDAGEFSFHTDAGPLPAAQTVPVEEVLAEAQSRRSEWLALEAAVPSLAARFRLSFQRGGGPVTLAPVQWQMLVALATGADARAAMDALGLGEVEGRRAVRALRDAGLLEPAPGPPPEPAAEPAAVVAPAQPAQPPAAHDEAGDQAGDETGGDHEDRPEPPAGPAAEDEPVSRSLLFRYLSGESF